MLLFYSYACCYRSTGTNKEGDDSCELLKLTMDTPEANQQKVAAVLANDTKESEAKAAPEAQSFSDGLDHSTQVTCDVLCSLMGSAKSSASGGGCSGGDHMSQGSDDCCPMDEKHKGMSACSKQLQLPMFLSSEFSIAVRSNSLAITNLLTFSDSPTSFVRLQRRST